LDIDGEEGYDHAGRSVALSQDEISVAVGSSLRTNVNGKYARHVRVFKYTSNQWVQSGQTMSGDAALNGFGSSLSFSGSNVIAIGAPMYSPTNKLWYTGYVKVMKLKYYVWYQLGPDIDNEFNGANFGEINSLSISRSGKRVAVGRNGARTGEMYFYGVVRVFDYNRLVS